MKTRAILPPLVLTLLLASCGPKAPPRGHPGVTRETLMGLLRPHLGRPHCMGGQGPRCFDCSGLARRIYGRLGVDLPRKSPDQARVGVPLPLRMDALRPGDLVFFDWGGGRIGHVGIYLGRGEFAHASLKRGVVIEELGVRWYWPKVVAARRVLG